MIRNILFILVFLPFFVLANNGQGQSMRFNHLDNYTYGNPRAIIIDNYGFLWIGTNDGLLK